MREDDLLKTVPFILLSARAGEEARVEGLEAGADDYLTKPFNAKELLAHVKTNLEHYSVRHREIQEAIRESEARFSSIFNQAVAGIAQTDLRGKFVLVNDRYCEMVGRSKEELYKIRMQDITHPEDLSTNIPLFERVVKEGVPFDIYKRYIRPDKSELWVNNNVSLIKDQSGNPIYILAISQDITDRKNAEESIQIKNEQLTRINNDLDNFIYTASHDLKAPVSNIEGLIHSLVDTLNAPNTESEDQKTIIDLINSSIQRFKDTILDLTEIGKVQKNFIEDYEELKIQEVIEDVKILLSDSIKETKAVITCDLEEYPLIQFSKANFKSVLFNLIGNAIKYHSPKRIPKVEIHCSKIDEYMLLQVKDNGLGIPAHNIDKIFTMFKRLHNHVEGSGVGLYLVKRIIDNAGGKIEVESEVDKGTTFKVYFKN